MTPAIQHEHEIRILIADDEPDIQQTYKRTLQDDADPKTNDDDEFDALSQELFGEVPSEPAKKDPLPPRFFTFCSQATEVVEAVRDSVEADCKYSMAFLDVRMPPGKDGIWAAEKIRQIDPDIQIVIVTGYSDIDPMQIANRVPPDDRLLYLQKPLHAFELRQLVATLSSRYTIEQNWRILNNNLTDEVERRTSELLRVNDELEHARRLESVGRLAAGMAHEINTPLQYINNNLDFMRDASQDLLTVAQNTQGFLDNISEENPTPEELAKCYETLKEADIDFLKEELPTSLSQSFDGVQRISKIINAMKGFSAIDSGEKIPVDINQCIEDTLVVCKNEWAGIADVKKNLDPQLPMATCFRGEINQALLNLIVNAVDAIKEKQGDNTEDKGVFCISTVNSKDSIEIQIQDSGTGIPEDIRPHVFDQFFTTKEVGQGTGQGLYITYNIVKRHNGRLSFKTSQEDGTTFIICLPLK